MLPSGIDGDLAAGIRIRIISVFQRNINRDSKPALI
jgi:hypothetical protein